MASSSCRIFPDPNEGEPCPSIGGCRRPEPRRNRVSIWNSTARNMMKRRCPHQYGVSVVPWKSGSGQPQFSQLPQAAALT